MHRPLTTLHLEPLPAPADRVVVVICRTGARSARAAALLRGRNVPARYVTGGMRAWARAGLPVERVDGTPGTIL